MSSASNPYRHASDAAQRLLTHRSNTAAMLARRGCPAHIVERYRQRAQQLAAAVIGAGCRIVHSNGARP